MAARVGLLTALLVVVTMITYTEAKSKNKPPSDDKSLLTLNFMGDGSLAKKLHDHKSQQNSSSHVAKTRDDKTKDASKSIVSKTAVESKKKVAKASIPSGVKYQQQNAVTRGSILDDISKIDDVQNMYRQGEKNDAGFMNDDHTIDKVKQIDDGELTDYFHALNGENEKQQNNAHFHDDDLRHDEEDLRHYDENTRHNDEEHSKEIGDEETQKYKDGGPGYEVFSDNPDDSDTDDFYDDISQGKKPEMKMKKVRPTKSHFGSKDEDENSAKPKFRNDKKAQTKEVDPDTLGYPYSVDRTPEPVETSAERLASERKKASQARIDDIGTGSKEYADSKEGHPLPANAYNSDPSHKSYSKGGQVVDNRLRAGHSSQDEYGDNKVSHDFVSNDYNPDHGRKDYDDNRPIHSRKNYDSDSGHKDYSDYKSEHSGKNYNSDTRNKDGPSTINGYSPFLNPFFNPFSIFGFQHKHHEDEQEHPQRAPDREQEPRPYRGDDSSQRQPDRDDQYSQGQSDRDRERLDNRPINREEYSQRQPDRERRPEGDRERRPGIDREQENLQRQPEKDQEKKPDRGSEASEVHQEKEKTNAADTNQQKAPEQVHLPESGAKPFRIKGTRIQGGKITGGTITGGVIEGGSIEGGSIEGGLIKGGHVEGGKFKNGTMEGGVFHDGLMEGGHLINGSFEGGRMRGGNIYGGQVRGGSIYGGDIKGGILLGGLFHGGSLEGGVMKGGEVHGGSIKGGNMEGGLMTGGSVEGGVLKYGRLAGGTIKAGSMLGGVMTNGSIEGGTLKGGAISGGVLKGGVMEGGELKGGVVLAGKIKGGIIEGGVVEGGEINDGVIIKSGRINGTILSVKSLKDDKKGKKEDGKEKGKISVTDKEGENLTPNEGSLTNVIWKEPKHVSHSDFMAKPTPQLIVIDDINNMKTTPKPPGSNGTKSSAPGLNGSHVYVTNSDLNGTMNETDFNDKDATHISISTTIHTGDTNDSPDTTDSPPMTELPATVTEMTAIPGSDENDFMTSPTIQPYVQLTGQNRDLTPAAKRVRPSYHWSLNSIMGDRIPGSPGAAMISHGHIRKTRGGIAFNGEDAWLGGGDFAGGCISAPDKCVDGFSFEMTLKIDKDSLFKSDDMRYIVDSGASTFNSKGFSLYTLHGKLRADIAIPNDSICLESPLEADRWHDVLVTWRKDKGLKLYLNCELKGEAQSSDQCLGCRSPGCHVTDKNTQLMIGRPNYSPHFHCTKFESGDISFWEKYLNQDDVNMLCGRETVSKLNKDSKTTSSTAQHLASKLTPNLSQRYADYQQANKGLSTSQQTYKPVNTAGSYSASYQSSYPAMYMPNVGYLKPGNTYHFTQYIPAVGTSSYSSYYPGQTRSKTASLHTSKPSYVAGVSANVITQPRNKLASSPIERQYFSPWGSWSTCSESCGYGVRARTRTCVSPRLLSSGRVCRGPSIQHGFCYMRACPGSNRASARKHLVRKILRDLVRDFTLKEGKKIPLPKTVGNLFQEKPTVRYGYSKRVDGGYGKWSPWGQCDRSCGRGGQVRTRLCNNPPPSIMGKSCVALGPSLQVQRCNEVPCPVDGGHSGWSAFSPCSKSCGSGGFQYRVRTCTKPSPAYGGKSCIGPLEETRSCVNYIPCSIPPRYAGWGQWSGCDADCGGGVRERVRQCIRRGASKGSCSPLGPSRMTELCNLNPC